MTMEFTEKIDELKSKIEFILKRFEVNHFVCTSKDYQFENVDFKAIDDFLSAGKHNKVTVNSIIFLNSLEKPGINDQIAENNDLENSIKDCSSLIKESIVEICKLGEYKYILNEVLHGLIKEIDSKIGIMNYHSWLKDKNPNHNDNVLLILVGKNMRSFRKAKVDYETWCLPFIDNHFAFRVLLLHKLKNDLVDIFSEYLLLPHIGTNPKIEYTCNQTDICELILAISYSKEITGSEQLKAILMDMFDITPDRFKNATYSIRNRAGEKSKFMQKLTNNIEKLPKSKKSSYKKI